MSSLQRRDLYVILRHVAKKFLVFSLLSIALKCSLMQMSMGLSYLSSITSQLLNVLHWMVFNLFNFYCVTVKTIWSLQCVVQPSFNPLSNVVNALGNIANAFENNYSALENVSNGWKNVTHFRCIFDLSLMPGFRK